MLRCVVSKSSVTRSILSNERHDLRLDVLVSFERRLHHDFYERTTTACERPGARLNNVLISSLVMAGFEPSGSYYVVNIRPLSLHAAYHHRSIPK